MTIQDIKLYGPGTIFRYVSKTTGKTQIYAIDGIEDDTAFYEDCVPGWTHVVDLSQVQATADNSTQLRKHIRAYVNGLRRSLDNKGGVRG